MLPTFSVTVLEIDSSYFPITVTRALHSWLLNGRGDRKNFGRGDILLSSLLLSV